jgi:hypothetical protein
VTAVSDDEARLVRTHFGVAPEVIPNGVSPELAPGRAPRRGWAADDRRREPVGALQAGPRGGAGARRASRLPADIVGDGPERGDVLQLADGSASPTGYG